MTSSTRHSQVHRLKRPACRLLASSTTHVGPQVCQLLPKAGTHVHNPRQFTNRNPYDLECLPAQILQLKISPLRLLTARALDDIISHSALTITDLDCLTLPRRPPVHCPRFRGCVSYLLPAANNFKSHPPFRSLQMDHDCSMTHQRVEKRFLRLLNTG